MRIEDRVKTIIEETLTVSADEVSMEMAFVEDLYAESLDIAELITRFEDEFDIKLPEDDLEGIVTVGQAVAYLEDKAA
jgi:acyl carrier protein